jgi:hypothetical protein
MSVATKNARMELSSFGATHVPCADTRVNYTQLCERYGGPNVQSWSSAKKNNYCTKQRTFQIKIGLMFELNARGRRNSPDVAPRVVRLAAVHVDVGLMSRTRSISSTPYENMSPTPG